MKIFTLELSFDIAWKDIHGCCEHLQMLNGRLALHGGRVGPGSGTSSDLVFLGQASGKGEDVGGRLVPLTRCFCANQEKAPA